MIKRFCTKCKVEIITIREKRQCRCNECINKLRHNYTRKNPWQISLWHARQRCNDKNVYNFERYGGRGIKCFLTRSDIKKIWMRDKAFKMKNPSLDRIDNDGHYSFENCRFLESKVNTSRGVYYRILKNGETLRQVPLFMRLGIT